MKKKMYLIMTFLTLTSIFGTSISALNREDYITNYIQNFDNSSIELGNFTTSGNATITENALYLNNTYLYYQFEKSFSEFELEFDFKKIDSGSYSRLMYFTGINLEIEIKGSGNDLYIQGGYTGNWVMNEYSHFKFVYSDNQLLIYLNDNLITTFECSSEITGFQFGKGNSNNNYFNGYIDNLKLSYFDNSKLPEKLTINDVMDLENKSRFDTEHVANASHEVSPELLEEMKSNNLNYCFVYLKDQDYIMICADKPFDVPYFSSDGYVLRNSGTVKYSILVLRNDSNYWEVPFGGDYTFINESNDSFKPTFFTIDDSSKMIASNFEITNIRESNTYQFKYGSDVSFTHVDDIENIDITNYDQVEFIFDIDYMKSNVDSSDNLFSFKANFLFKLLDEIKKETGEYFDIPMLCYKRSSVSQGESEGCSAIFSDYGNLYQRENYKNFFEFDDQVTYSEIKVVVNVKDLNSKYLHNVIDTDVPYRVNLIENVTSTNYKTYQFYDNYAVLLIPIVKQGDTSFSFSSKFEFKKDLMVSYINDYTDKFYNDYNYIWRIKIEHDKIDYIQFNGTELHYKSALFIQNIDKKNSSFTYEADRFQLVELESSSTSSTIKNPNTGEYDQLDPNNYEDYSTFESLFDRVHESIKSSLEIMKPITNELSIFFSKLNPNVTKVMVSLFILLLITAVIKISRR